LIQPIESVVIQGADHLWAGYEIQMAEHVAGFFSRFLSVLHKASKSLNWEQQMTVLLHRANPLFHLSY
jgi:hypothetical protein